MELRHRVENCDRVLRKQAGTTSKPRCGKLDKFI